MAAQNAPNGAGDDLPNSVENLDSVQRLDRWLDSPPDKYFDELIKTASVATGALAGQVWGLKETGRLVKVSSTNPAIFEHLDQPEILDNHRNLISKVLFEGQLTSNRYLHRDGLANVERTLVLAPFNLEQESIGVVELILPRDMDDQRLPVVNELLAHVSGYLSKRAQLQPAPPADEAENQPAARTGAADVPPVSQTDQSMSADLDLPVQASGRSGHAQQHQRLSAQQVEHFVWQLHQHVDVKYVASTAVNETRRLLECDRVCLAVRRANSTEVIAISGQDTIARKSNTIRVIREIAEQVITSGQLVQFDGDETFSQRDGGSLLAYLGETQARRLQVFPLFACGEIDFETDRSNTEQVAFAALVIEQFLEGRGPDNSELQRLVPHISQATYHALDQEQIFLLPIRRLVGRWIEKSKLTRTKTRLALAGLAFMIGLLTFVKVPYRVQATGKLMPSQQFRAYAPFDCEVREILVRTGQHVRSTQPLVKLYDERLETRLLILTNSIEEKKQLLAAHKAQLDENAAALSQTEKIGLSAKIAQNSIEIEGLKLQLESAQRSFEQASVCSEISGTVATFRPEDLLAGRPVARGELLLEVMNEQGPWNLELELPADRFGHLRQATADNPSGVSVTFIQATAPEKTYAGVIQQISTRTSPDEKGSAVILIRASINEGQNIRRTIGAEVIAKISCGNKSLGYVWFGDLLDWIRRRFW